MLAAFLNKDSHTPDWCRVQSYEVLGDQVLIHYDFPCGMGRKSSEYEVSLLELMAWLWENSNGS